MADNLPNIPGGPPPSIPSIPSIPAPSMPAGAMPPKKETGKVQPKKETVRISLPPKPSAAPTIKLPTLPPGGPSGVPGGARSAPVLGAQPGAPAAPRPPAPGAPAGATMAAPKAAPAPAAAKRPMAPAPVAAKSSGLDTVLAIAAMVAALLAVGSVVYVGFMI